LIIPTHLLLDESLPRCHSRMKERATETAYDPDPICRCLRPDQVMTSFPENTQCWTWTFCRAACHQSIVLSYPQGLLMYVFLSRYTVLFILPKAYRRLAFQNANFGVFPHHHNHHLALHMAHNEFRGWKNSHLTLDSYNAMVIHQWRTKVGYGGSTSRLS
jgi:hypothetical protein